MDAVMERELQETRETLKAEPYLDEQYDFEDMPMDQPSHHSSAPGVGGAVNISPVFDEYDKYIEDIAMRLMQDFDFETEEDVYEFIYDVADSCFESGECPEPVSEESTEEDVVAWMAAAKGIHFGGYVMQEAGAASEAGE